MIKEKQIQINFSRNAFYLIFLILTSQKISIAQDEPSFPVLIPPSVSVSSLGMFIDHPVDYYTGIPKIEIPLYEIKTQNISIPIVLTYHASGIKVDQMASWVGLGWSLISGGYISRTVRGLPDDQGPWETDYTSGHVHRTYGYLDLGANISSLINDAILR